ncbi:MAG: hypothetical protein P4L22_07235 [Candidatus Babeliales bacterium]|nr:hypothetical protein [Candidatus Babeliales bacterium]
MKIKNLLIASILTLNFASLNAYIFNLEVLENGLSNNKQYVIKAGDAHFGCQEGYEHPTLTCKEITKINKTQALSIVNIAATSPNDSLFILEDMYEYTGKNQKIEQMFNEYRVLNKKNNFSTCMDDINNLCKEQNIDVANIEFRHSKSLFFANLETTADKFLEDFNCLVSTIEKYNDNEIANNYYSTTINRLLEQNKKLLNVLETNKASYFNQIKDQISELDLDNFNEDLCDLIDIQIVHTVLKHKDKKYIFICAGDTHIQRINKILEQINFKTIYAVKESNLDYPIDFKITLSKLVVANHEVESPYIFVFMLLIFFLSIKFPTRFRILHFHNLQLNSKMGDIK